MLNANSVTWRRSISRRSPMNPGEVGTKIEPVEAGGAGIGEFLENP
jgi:hypothetical protein